MTDLPYQEKATRRFLGLSSDAIAVIVGLATVTAIVFSGNRQIE